MCTSILTSGKWKKFYNKPQICVYSKQIFFCRKMPFLIMTSYLKHTFNLLYNKSTESNVYSIFSDIARFCEVCPLSITYCIALYISYIYLCGFGPFRNLNRNIFTTTFHKTLSVFFFLPKKSFLIFQLFHNIFLCLHFFRLGIPLVSLKLHTK